MSKHKQSTLWVQLISRFLQLIGLSGFYDTQRQPDFAV